MGINRNIVECKGMFSRHTMQLELEVLIETLWNVKTDGRNLSCAEPLCINRNIVECKE